MPVIVTGDVVARSRSALFYALAVRFAGLLLLLSLISPAQALSLEQQRDRFVEARKAIKAGQIDKYKKLAHSLENYPLYPYLRYEYIEQRLRSLPQAEIESFLQQHSDLPMTDRLRNRWLDLLASRGQWQDYIDHYKQPNDNRLRCLYLTARMKTGQMDEALLEDIRTLWRVGYSQHEACDPVFAKFESSPMMTDDLIWQRLRLTLDNHNAGLANYLVRKLDGSQRKLGEKLIAMHRNPAQELRNPQLADTPKSREILMHGLIRLAYRDVDQALKRWQQLQTHFDFQPAERDQIGRHLAVRAADDEHRQALPLLDQVAADQVDGVVFIYRLRYALNNDNWQKLRAWTSGEPPQDVDKAQWQYWHARALEQLGNNEKARDIYHQLAAQRDFYGFLAADRLGVGYQMNHFPVPVTEEQRQKVADTPALSRAFEFLALGEEYNARREWHHMLGNMTSFQMQIAAELAADRGWHDQAILAMGRAKAYDDLKVRFPVLYHDALQKYASKHNLDLAWVYGLIRSESAFWEDARSPAGALGLMQVMPRTGKETARKIGMKNFSSNQLLEARYNIPIGSRYLKMMYDNFNGNMILATAAYNAGPHRVKSWLPKSGCMEPDIWIENIPFYETRNYVKRVLSYASIYDWRLQGERKPISARMAVVQPLRKSDTMLAGLNCSAAALSMNP